MALLNRLALVGPLNEAIRSGRKVVAYQTFTPLGANAVFQTPIGSLRQEIESPAVAAGDFISWGDVEYVRVRAKSDQDSAANGLVLEITDDGVTAVATKLLQVSYGQAGGEYNSGWKAIKGRGFRFRYTNGATPQTFFFALVEVTGDPDIIPPA